MSLYIVVVGSSGAGKTTLVNGLRSKEFEGLVNIPKRYITRPQRAGDDLIENHHVNKEDFDRMVEEGRIWPYWKRELDEGRFERYGFEKTDESKLVILSANNAFLRDDNESLRTVLQDALVVLVESSSSQRTERLSERSPDMSSSERSYRLADNGFEDHRDYEVIDTSDLSPEKGQRKMQIIVEGLLNGKR